MKAATVKPGIFQWGVFRAPGGWCGAAWSSKGLAALVLPQKSPSASLARLKEYMPKAPKSLWESKAAPVPALIRKETINALSGREFDVLDADVRLLTPFQRKVLTAASRIPRGEIRTYGWVARKAGSPKGYRAAGQVLNRNPVPVFIPCHRVVGEGNSLGGYGGGVSWKIKLLRAEGVETRRDRVEPRGFKVSGKMTRPK